MSNIDAFLTQYYARHPVNATFTGVHMHDARLPDWSRAARADAAHEEVDLHAHLTNDPSLDAQLACAHLDVRAAELESRFMHDRNPALWTGEAIFGAVSLMVPSFAPRAERLAALTARLAAVPSFLHTLRATLADTVPELWTARALRECRAAVELFGPGLDTWLSLHTGDDRASASVRAAAIRVRAAFHECHQWLNTRPAASEQDSSAGAAFFDVLLRRGHFCDRPAAELLGLALDAIENEKARLAALACEVAGSWDNAQNALVEHHPKPDQYYDAFTNTWNACRSFALEHDLVTWPDWPLRYVPIPVWARGAAPELYWLFYRSPAPLDEYTIHDYVVTPIDPELDESERTRRLHACNHSVIKLNHVVHHGALGHHVQNWHATHRSCTRIGTIAAVDCASRIGMFLGGSLAEGWACYATELMDELGFLSPLERVAQQHSRVRMLARAIVDIRLHTQALTPTGAARYYREETGMVDQAARNEVSKNTMFPCTALMYWLGTQGILELRSELQRQQGAAFRLKTFHDQLLSYGSIPVPLVARLMTRKAP
ncbi:MAG: DUF885 family protein [Longimicrobiales bacterium]